MLLLAMNLAKIYMAESKNILGEEKKSLSLESTKLGRPFNCKNTMEAFHHFSK